MGILRPIGVVLTTMFVIPLLFTLWCVRVHITCTLQVDVRNHRLRAVHEGTKYTVAQVEQFAHVSARTPMRQSRRHARASAAAPKPTTALQQHKT
jgi:hypothetical protein